VSTEECLPALAPAPPVLAVMITRQIASYKKIEELAQPAAPFLNASSPMRWIPLCATVTKMERGAPTTEKTKTRGESASSTPNSVI